MKSLGSDTDSKLRNFRAKVKSNVKKHLMIRPTNILILIFTHKLTWEV